MRYQLKGHYYNGQFHASEGSQSLKKYSPANLQDLLWETSYDPKVCEEIAESANSGFHTWKRMSLEERKVCLVKFQEEVKKREDDIAIAIALEVGKPLWEAKTEAAALANKVSVTINHSLPRVKNKNYPEIMPNIEGHILYKPLGACFVIGPFNFPCHLANGQIISALLMGNSIIFKPSEKTLYSSQLMFECLANSGFPKGVVNFVIGGGDVAQALITHPKIKGIFFTGSKNVGLKIKEATVHSLDKLVALELGGKNSSIIHEDAPLEHALSELIKACFLTSGQRCTSTGTILVHQKIYQEFAEKFKSLSQRIIVDHPIEFEQMPFMGPVIDEHAGKLYHDYVKNMEQQGATSILPFEKVSTKFEGYYYTPAIHEISSFDPGKHSFVLDEVFAPHCTLIPYNDLEEAVQIANSTEYGLAGALFTNNAAHYKYCCQELDVGIFNWNRSTVGANAKLPFGGVKSSGNFRPAGVSMIDSTVHALASLETKDTSSSLDEIPGLR